MMAMDRGRLIQLAPQYYTCAICAFVARSNNRVASLNTLWNEVTGMKHGPTFLHVMEILVERGMLDRITDDFGPTIYVRTDAFAPAWQQMRNDHSTPYYKWEIDPEGEAWLSSALEQVNKALDDQKIKHEDYVKPDIEWEPIPIDRSNEKVRAATEALDKAIVEVEQDNGYAANVPGERDFVLDSLKSGANKLKKDDSISFAYLRRTVLEPLGMIIQRFGKAALGLTASAARQAIFEWLKTCGTDIIHWISSLV